MNKKDFAEKILKGRMAETLVEELLRESGNTVYRFGYEAIMQNLPQLKKSFDTDDDTVERIRAIPDFIVIDKNNRPLLLEVKYRWNSNLHDDDHERLRRIKEYWKAKMIFVNRIEKPFFRVSNPPYVDDAGNLQWKPLIKDTDWKISTEVYEKFEGLVDKYLTPTLIEEKP